MFGISHGAFQFVAYEELKTRYSKYRNQALDARLVSAEVLISFTLLYVSFIDLLHTKVLVSFAVLCFKSGTGGGHR